MSGRVPTKRYKPELKITTITLLRRKPRVEMDSRKFIGKLFSENWRAFFNNHQDEYKRFLTQSKGVRDTLKTRQQWAVMWIAYRMGRYTGTLGVNFKLTKNRKDIQRTRKVQRPVRTEAAIRGKEFSILLQDIIQGTSYTDNKTKDSYCTFGDCDEIATLIAQLIKIASDEMKLGMEPQVYRFVESHGETLTKIDGKWFMIDPSMLGRSTAALLEDEFRLNMNNADVEPSFRLKIKRAYAALRAGKRPPALYNDEYERKHMPKLNAIIQQRPELWPGWKNMSTAQRRRITARIRLPKISKREQKEMHKAMQRAIAMSGLAEARVDRETVRRMWGHNKGRGMSRIKRFMRSVQKTYRLRKHAVGVLCRFVAASLTGEYRKNLRKIETIVSNYDVDRQIKILKSLVEKIEANRRAKLTIAQVERIIKRRKA